MSVYRRMLGRGLPCSVSELLSVANQPLSAGGHATLVDLAEDGRISTDGLLKLGLSHMERNEWGLAKLRLNQALARSSGMHAARLALACVHEQLAQHDRAAAQIDALLALVHPQESLPPQGELLLASGIAWEQARQAQTAANRYEGALELSPQDATPRYRLVSLHLAHHDTPSAAAHLTELLRSQPTDQSARVCLAHLLLADDQLTQAAWEYEQALCLEPDSWELPSDADPILKEFTHADQAVHALEQLVHHQPHFPDLRMRLGSLYAQLGQDDAARREFGEALSLHPDYLDCHLAMARHELGCSRVDAAAGHLRRARSINARHVETYTGLGLATHRLGRVSQAHGLLRSASRIAANGALLAALLDALDGGHARAEELAAVLMDAHAQSGWIQQRLDLLTETFDADPSRTDLLIPTASLLRLCGRHRQAAAVLRRYLRGGGDCTSARLELGFCMLTRAQTERGLQMLAAAIDPKLGVSAEHYQLALIYSAELEFDLTMEHFDDVEDGDDVQQGVWGAVDSLHMGGSLTAGAADEDRPAITTDLTGA
jgi:tetratricopeptide (TPR) repeat protein